ncbi:MAG TPA: ATP-binding protein [Candidatus Desulfaltia sp.]|nr:ATP-binding protein [Candidatus Desulfaltia sp.]
MLSVDDDSDQLFFLKRNLERLNKAITVQTVTTPREVFSAIKDSIFDCIVSDYKMPAMDGVELCKRVKDRVDTPFILYTGQGSEEVAERAFHAGADDYVRKEVDPSHYQVLARRVEQAVARYRVEELYRTVVDGSRDAFTIKDATMIVYANQAMADLVGFQRPEDLVGVDASTLVHPDDRDPYIAWTLSRQNGQEASKFLEFRIVKPDGEERIIEASFSRVNYRGNPANLAFNRDVTDRKTMEEAMRKEVELRETILRSMQDIVSLKDLSYRYIFVNDAAFPDGKTEPGDAVGRTCYEVNYQRDRPCDGCVYAVVLETGELRKAVTQLPDGRIIHTFSSPIRDEQGRMVQVLSVSRDVTELNRARRRLEALHSHVLRLSETQSLQEIANRSLEIIEDALQFPKGAFGVVRDGYLEWIDESNASLPEHKLALDGPGITVRAVRTGEAQLVPDTRLDPDFVSRLEKYRGVKHLSELDVPVKVHGRVAAVINLESTEASAFTDDDRRLLEVFAGHVASSLSRLTVMDDLERQVTEKTEALLDAEKLAAVGRVASMVAHDLRSPLQTIRNVSYIVSRDPSKAKEYCPVIDENVRYASSIVEDLRDAVAPGKLRRAPVNLVELVSAALGESAVPDSVEVRREFPEEFLAASVDAVKLRRALENLIKNAVEAMPRGGVLTVGLAQVDGGAVISVRDTGGGVPEEARASVFKPFFSTKPRGTGLGLAIAKHSVEAHGGSIGYESEVGKGTVFTLRLPLKG